MTWTRLILAQWQAKTHFVPPEYADAVIDDINAKYPDDIGIPPVEEIPVNGGSATNAYGNRESGITAAGIDTPGMVYRDRTWWRGVLDNGMEVTWPHSDHKHFVDKVRSAKPYPGGYYKLHGWIHCIVLTPDHRDQLLALIAADDEAWVHATYETTRRQQMLSPSKDN